MTHEDLYDELCRILTDYEGNGTEDEDVIDNIIYLNDFLHNLAEVSDMNEFIRLTIERVIDDNNPASTDDEIYDLGCRCQVHWGDLWV